MEALLQKLVDALYAVPDAVYYYKYIITNNKGGSTVKFPMVGSYKNIYGNILLEEFKGLAKNAIILSEKMKQTLGENMALSVITLEEIYFTKIKPSSASEDAKKE